MRIILPLAVVLPRKKGPDKIWTLNLNLYRNAHHMILSQAKSAYGIEVSRRLCQFLSKPDPPYHFTYTVYPGNSRKFDLANVLPVIQKFTDDALIQYGLIEEDNYKIIRAIDYRFGGVDKGNPRAELEIASYAGEQEK